MKWTEMVAVCTLILTIGATLVGGIGVYNYYYNENARIDSERAAEEIEFAMEHGYSQQTLPGTSGVYWVKDEEVFGE